MLIRKLVVSATFIVASLSSWTLLAAEMFAHRSLVLADEPVARQIGIHGTWIVLCLSAIAYSLIKTERR